MKQKTFFWERVILFLALAICGAFCTVFAVRFGGMELLLAMVVLTMFCDGALTIWLCRKWLGVILHILWAGWFCYEVFYSHALSIDINWQWYFLWVLLGCRVFILQPIYWVKISQQERIS